jgi:hypothetical protein
MNTLKILTTTIIVPPIYSYKIFLKGKSLRGRIMSDLYKFKTEGVNEFMTTFKIRSSNRYRIE